MMNDRVALTGGETDGNGYGTIGKESLEVPLISKPESSSKYHYDPNSEKEKLVFYHEERTVIY